MVGPAAGAAGRTRGWISVGLGLSNLNQLVGHEPPIDGGRQASNGRGRLEPQRATPPTAAHGIVDADVPF